MKSLVVLLLALACLAQAAPSWPAEGDSTESKEALPDVLLPKEPSSMGAATAKPVEASQDSTPKAVPAVAAVNLTKSDVVPAAAPKTLDIAPTTTVSPAPTTNKRVRRQATSTATTKKAETTTKKVEATTKKPATTQRPTTAKPTTAAQKVEATTVKRVVRQATTVRPAVTTKTNAAPTTKPLNAMPTKKPTRRQATTTKPATPTTKPATPASKPTTKPAGGK